jgi:triphosphatase
MAHHGEIELKFELDVRSAGKLRRHALLSPAPRRQWLQRTVYFDTADSALRRKGYTLRVRKIGKSFVQTVKSIARSAGLFEREEWESPVRALCPDPKALEQMPLATLSHLGRLEPVAEFGVDRTSWIVSRDGSELEVVLDCGSLSAGGRKQPLHELEIELKVGDPHVIFAIAEELAHSVPMKIGVLSKEERGLMLARRMLDREQKSLGPDIRKRMDVRQAVEAIVHECVRHFRLNERAIIEHREPEAVHQARVALRRLRSALSFFRPAIRPRSLDPLRSKLEELALPLARARNIDVFLARHGEELGEADRHKLSLARDEAYDRLIDELGRQRSRDLLLGMIEWAAWHWGTKRADDPIRDFAVSRFDSAWRKMKGRVSRLSVLDDSELHRLRIAVKKLRYAVEFLAALYPEKAVREFVRSLEGIQDGFGFLHDGVMARELTAELSLDLTIPDEAQDRSSRLDEAAAHFKRLKRLGPVWAL